MVLEKLFIFIFLFFFLPTVNSWGGNRSAIDQEFEKDRNEAKKRTADDLYNEEFDRGRVSIRIIFVIGLYFN